MITETPEKPKNRTSRCAPEALIQKECFVWFWNTYPQFRRLLFHVENEATVTGYETLKQRKIRGARRKMMGVVEGVSDLIGLIPNGRYHGFCVEFKTATGRQSDAQVIWQEKVESVGYYYFVPRCLDDFKREITFYLGLPQYTNTRD